MQERSSILNESALSRRVTEGSRPEFSNRSKLWNQSKAKRGKSGKEEKEAKEEAEEKDRFCGVGGGGQEAGWQVDRKGLMDEIRQRRDKIDEEIRNLTKSVKVSDALRKDLFGPVSTVPYLYGSLSIKQMENQMGGVWGRYRKARDNIKAVNKVIDGERERLNET